MRNNSMPTLRQSISPRNKYEPQIFPQSHKENKIMSDKKINITQRGLALVEGRLALSKLKNGQAVENRFFICLKDSAGKMYTIDKDNNKLLEGI